jgi:pimeloyl-ACP methyl ester carboxylesterase
MPELAKLLSTSFTAVTYDRRGRGDSGDNQPCAVEREIEDIEALIDAVGGFAYLYGVSSGGCLVLEAAIKLGGKVKKISVYEPPCKSGVGALEEWEGIQQKAQRVLSHGS